MMSVKHFDLAGFNAEIPAAPLAMVDFWATWCGPCKMLAPVIEQVGTQYEGKALIGKVDVDQQPELARRYGVMSIPTVIFFKDGVEVDRKVGLMPIDAYTKVLDARK
jgi:thioredoxin 1